MSSSNARAVPKPKAAWHHQSECADGVGVGRWKVKNAARRYAKADAQGVIGSGEDSEGWRRALVGDVGNVGDEPGDW
ncbi:hypothetical protein CYMTET_53571 [Cymbomonas tetramitiformis]|uniref:Uncharacterized protein n=1 Tax=Cymbomonas tetramitiformis TaxID=36881 RepID=A0AAE0BIG1_9CHLO|nr:hypothetical protein CYMTET_53571 [Cymbomonas tetramitiformis]